MDPKDLVISQIQDRLSGGQRPLIVGLSGIECSGKTTLAGQVTRSLNDAGISTYATCIDRFLNPKRVRHQGDSLADAYYSNTFRLDDVADQLVRPIRAHGSIHGDITVHDLDSDELHVETLALPKVDVLIVEGVFLFRAPLIDCFDLKIWLDIPFARALERANERPLEIEQYGKGAITERYNARYFPAQRRHIEVDHPEQQADLVIPV